MGVAPASWTGHRQHEPAADPPDAGDRGTVPEPTEAWATEMKWDGVRAVAYVVDGVRFLSRNDRDMSVSYPELRGLPAALGVRDAVLDGEIVATDAHGRPDFGLLQSRMHIVDAGKAAKLAEQTPVDYLVFDVLALDGQSTLALPYVERRELLRRLDIGGNHFALPPSFDGDPAHALAASLEQGLEGVVCKRLDSIYTPGRRSPVVDQGEAPAHARSRRHRMGARPRTSRG